MKITYDQSADAAYIQLSDSLSVDHTFPCPPAETGRAMIQLDFQAGVLCGIEILNASQSLPPALLKTAKPLDPPVDLPATTRVGR